MATNKKTAEAAFERANKLLDRFRTQRPHSIAVMYGDTGCYSIRHVWALKDSIVPSKIYERDWPALERRLAREIFVSSLEGNERYL